MEFKGVIQSVVLACTFVSAGSVWAQSLANRPLPNRRGTIQGELIYPSNVILAQRVCARHVETAQETCVETSQNQARYSLAVQSGIYQVFATACKRSYEREQKCVDGYGDQHAYYNAFVQCGLTYQCLQQTTDNSPILIKVDSGMTIEGVNPHDWYSN